MEYIYTHTSIMGLEQSEEIFVDFGNPWIRLDRERCFYPE
jgi:hypothetical protein